MQVAIMHPIMQALFTNSDDAIQPTRGIFTRSYSTINSLGTSVTNAEYQSRSL